MHYCELGGRHIPYPDDDWYKAPYNSGEYRCKSDLEQMLGTVSPWDSGKDDIWAEVGQNPRRYSYTSPEGTCDSNLWYNGLEYLEPDEEQCKPYLDSGKGHWAMLTRRITCTVSLIDESMAGKVEVDKDVYKWECSVVPDDNWVKNNIQKQIQGRRCDNIINEGDRCDVPVGYSTSFNGFSVTESSCLLGKEGSTYLCTCVYTGREKVLEDVPVIMLN